MVVLVKDMLDLGDFHTSLIFDVYRILGKDNSFSFHLFITTTPNVVSTPSPPSLPHASNILRALQPLNAPISVLLNFLLGVLSTITYFNSRSAS